MARDTSERSQAALLELQTPSLAERPEDAMRLLPCRHPPCSPPSFWPPQLWLEQELYCSKSTLRSLHYTSHPPH
ncbi:hypothetical protein CBOM_07652 [Ceraceosorus bombacis]|uniref:Uncharacterized protein n=1 Tax=Ceraceosorus bombacis TaxID=401625 RepID=A0A0P1BKW2_9BASI|nr:hypothetical protein CBOM_07652 [Ceraceosorus bombacis]